MEKELEGLIDEVRLLWNALVGRGERIHEGESITLGMRAVLEFLGRNGPTSVPNIARRRGVTRQHIQTLANDLLDEACVELLENPAHRRSALVALTAKGERTLARMRRREAAAFEDAEISAAPEQLARAAKVLATVRRGLEGLG